MHINELINITVADIIKDYVDNSEDDGGITGYGGNLNIRPKYQRNFVYDDEKRAAVIHTLSKGFPLGIMYWVKNNDGKYEILDGQQRTISICQYIEKGKIGEGFTVSGLFNHNRPLAWNDLTPTEQGILLKQHLIIFECEGADEERLEWFETINIAGEELSKQELRNAQYPSAWLTDARRYFSKTSPKNNLAKRYAEYYVDAKWNRQGGLEKVIKWFIGELNNSKAICEYMSKMKEQSDICGVTEAVELIEYYKTVIDWAQSLFPKKREKMGEVEWGILYNKYHQNRYDVDELEKTVAKLYEDKDVTTKEGIYEYVFDHSESHLHIRQFPEEIKTHVYETQGQKCQDCGQHFALSDLQAHHIKRWIDGGHTTVDNCILLCRNCHGARHRVK